MNTNYCRSVELTDDEKFLAYSKLTKSEIIRMHIELEKMVRMMDGRTEVRKNIMDNLTTNKPYPYIYTDVSGTLSCDTSKYSIS
jgi:hypothetical protein